MTAIAAIGPRRTRHGYVAVAPVRVGPCASPVEENRLHVTPGWVTSCFGPAYAYARRIWGPHASAIAKEIVGTLFPSMRIGDPQTGAEFELRRRVQLAVASMLNTAGIPTPYPGHPMTPRPLTMPPGPPWYRALLTGWLQ